MPSITVARSSIGGSPAQASTEAVMKNTPTWMDASLLGCWSRSSRNVVSRWSTSRKYSVRAAAVLPACLYDSALLKGGSANFFRSVVLYSDGIVERMPLGSPLGYAMLMAREGPMALGGADRASAVQAAATAISAAARGMRGEDRRTGEPPRT